MESSPEAFAKYFADLAFLYGESVAVVIAPLTLADPAETADLDKPFAASAGRFRPFEPPSSDAVAVETWTGDSSFDSCFVDVER